MSCICPSVSQASGANQVVFPVPVQLLTHHHHTRLETLSQLFGLDHQQSSTVSSGLMFKQQRKFLGSFRKGQQFQAVWNITSCEDGEIRWGSLYCTRL